MASRSIPYRGAVIGEKRCRLLRRHHRRRGRRTSVCPPTNRRASRPRPFLLTRFPTVCRNTAAGSRTDATRGDHLPAPGVYNVIQQAHQLSMTPNRPLQTVWGSMTRTGTYPPQVRRMRPDTEFPRLCGATIPSPQLILLNSVTRMSEPNAGMFQKGEGERGLAPDAHAARSNGGPQRRDVRRAEIGRFTSF